MASRRIRFSRISDWLDRHEGESYKFSKRVYNEDVVPCENIWGSCWTTELDIRECYGDDAAYARACSELQKDGSAAMWGSYCVGGGVRVRSTLGKIRGLVKEFSDNEGLSLAHGPITYSPDIRICANEFDSLFHKRPPFRHESEYRFLLVDQEQQQQRVELQLNNPFDFFDEMLVGPTTSVDAWATDVVYQAIAASVGVGGNSNSESNL